MSQRTSRDDNGTAEVYDAPTTARTTRPVATAPVVRPSAAPVDVDVVTPVDRVRWGAVLAGLFAALSTLAALSVLGLAVGASAFDPGDTGSTFGLGAGIWGAVSTLLAFLVGGFIAARSAAVRGRSGGILNGAMVWFVAIPLLIYALGAGIGAIGRTLGNVASTVATVAAPVAGQAAEEAASNPQAQASAAAGADALASTAAGALDQVQQQASDPRTQEQIATTVRDNAWRTLLGLGLAAAAAIGGGILGSRRDAHDDDHAVTTARA
jgi:hypothetical protein